MYKSLLMDVTKGNSDSSIIEAIYVFVRVISCLARVTQRHWLHQLRVTVHMLLSRVQIEANQWLYLNLSDNDHGIERQP